jgi:hypothetical protein
MPNRSRQNKLAIEGEPRAPQWRSLSALRCRRDRRQSMITLVKRSGLVSPETIHPLMKSRRSALTRSLSVVHMPWGAPG